MLLVMMRDTTAEMVTRSETDPLSSVLNRRGFEHHGELALLRGSEAAVLVAADLDNFKQINDSFGHAAGDGGDRAFRRDAGRRGAGVGDRRADRRRGVRDRKRTRLTSRQ